METTRLQQVTTIPRRDRNRVQRIRFYSQLFSLVINLWIGLQFYLWIKSLEFNFSWLPLSRPPGVEGWLPISSLVSLRYWLESGIINNIHPAGLIIFLVILLTAILFKKGFCSWVCPVGFVSELLGDISDKIWRRRLKPPAWLDWPLRMLKYLLLAFFTWAILIQMTPDSIKQFIYTDYNKVADILMLRFFTDISQLSLIVIGLLFLFSLVIRGFWCRYLCPYGALLGLCSLVSPTRIKRNPGSCIDCSTCAKVCPAFIKVDKVKEVISDECSGCMACVDNCPVTNTLEIQVARKRKTFSHVKWAAVLVLFFWGSLLIFKMLGPWENSISDEEYRQHLPAIERGEYTHP